MNIYNLLFVFFAILVTGFATEKFGRHGFYASLLFFTVVMMLFLSIEGIK